MDERARIPVGLPAKSPTVSYWQDPPSAIANLRTTPDLPDNADFLIIGSGISGSCIAYNLVRRRPDAIVVMLEARQACSGATGRNGGHTKAASYRSFLDHEREYGVAEAVKIARMEYDNIKATHRLAQECGFDCASTECDTVDIIYSAAQLEQGKRAISRMRDAMGTDDPAAEYTVCNSDETQKRFFTPEAVGSFQYAAGSLSAYDFTTDVLKLALATGLNLQTETPAIEIEAHRNDSVHSWKVHTPRGSIEAPHLILATNGYTAHLLPEMQGLIVPLQGQIVAQRPGHSLPQQGLETTYSFIYDSGYEYMITRPPGSRNEGDIIIGGGLHKLPNTGASRYGNTDDSSLDPTISAYLCHCTKAAFKQYWGNDHAEGRVKKEWSGIMGATADGLPYVGQMPDKPGLWVSAGFNGHGMVLCLKAAEALVDMMTEDDEVQTSLRQWFPQSMLITNARLTTQFTGRRDLNVSGEDGFGTRVV